MKKPETLLRFVLGMGLAFAATVPAFAAPVFNSASNLQITGCFGNPNVPSGSLASNPVNGGAGVILSGSASVTDATTLCMQLEWGGSMSGSIDSIADIPIAWDFNVSVTDLAQPVVSSDIYLEISHQPYFVGGFNQGGYAYSKSYVGSWRIHLACQPKKSLAQAVTRQTAGRPRGAPALGSSPGFSPRGRSPGQGPRV